MNQSRLNRDTVRRVALGLTVITAILYYLIGFRVVEVLADDPTGQTTFGLIAGTAFALGAVVIARYDKRVLWVLGTLGLGFVIWTYFNLAPDRDPSFELWGILIRVVQVPLLITLGYLAITSFNEEVSKHREQKELQTQ